MPSWQLQTDRYILSLRAMRVTVKLFARGRELAGGVGSADFELAAGANTADLLRAVEARFPGLADESFKASLALALNCEYVPLGEGEPHRDLKEGDEVALIPPISGG